MGDEPDGALDDRRRTAVVHLQVNTSQPGKHGGETEDTADVGEPPAVDALVVVADEEDAIRGRRKQQGEPELRPIDILDLVDEQLAAASPPAGEERLVGRQHVDRPQDEVVEVEAARRCNGTFVVDEGSCRRAGVRVVRDLVGGHAQLKLQPRDRGVEPHPFRGIGIRAHPTEDRVAVGQRLDGHARVAQDLAPERMEGPDGDTARRDAQRLQRRIQPLGHLLGGPLVEGDRADGVGRRAAVDQPRRPGHEGRRLARPGRRNTQDRAGRCRGRGALVEGQAREPGFDVGMHMAMVARRPSLPVIPVPRRTADAGPFAETRNTYYHGVNEALS